MKDRLEHLHPALFLGLLLLIAGWPALTQSYGFREDYGHVARLITGHANFPANVMLEGRPLYALTLWFFGHIIAFFKCVDHFFWQRLAGMLGVWAFGVSLVQLAVKQSYPARCVMIFTGLLVLTPPFLLSVYWPAMHYAPLAGLAGLWGGYHLWEGIVTTRRRQLALGSALIFTALCTYQPAAMSLTIYPLLAVSHSGVVRNVKMLVKWSLIALLVGIAYWAFYRYGLMELLYRDHPLYADKQTRLAISISKIPERYLYYVTHYYRDAWDYISIGWWILLLLPVIIFDFRAQKKWLLILSAIIFIPLIGNLPSLASASLPLSPYRFQWTVYALAAVMWLYMLTPAWQKMDRHLPRATYLLVAGILLLAFIRAQTYQRDFVAVRNAETAAITHMLERFNECRGTPYTLNAPKAPEERERSREISRNALPFEPYGDQLIGYMASVFFLQQHGCWQEFKVQR